MASQSPSDSIREAYLARDDGTGKAGESAVRFTPSDVPIYAVIVLSSAASVTVKMDLVAADVPGVRAETRVVSTNYKTKAGEDRVNFTGRPEGKWTVGKYRADIFINGKLIRKLTFEIKSASPPIEGGQHFQPRGKPATSRVSRKY